MKVFKVYFIRPGSYRWWFHGNLNTLEAAKDAAAAILAIGPGKVIVYDSRTGDRAYEVKSE